MEKLGVISKVDEPTEWCAGMVVVPKSNSDVRICIDFTKLNESVKPVNYQLPAVEESLAKLANARMFTKLDANSLFWQTNIAEESRPLTTFITPFGRYCCNRLPFGINSASEFFQKRMPETVEGYPGVLCHMDDVLVFGASQEERDERLERILEAIGKAGLILNEKCEFSKPSVKFLGQIVDASGCRVDPDKVKAIAEMAKSTDISGVRRFLGMVNQLNKFSYKATELTKPLRELLKTHNALHWGKAQETAFTEIKNELASSGTLGHYDQNKDTVVSADASSFGLGAVIRQKHGEILKPVAYSSRSMTDTEHRNAQIQKEALALNWACEKFSNYLIGKKFNLETDHKSLVPLLSSKGIAELPPRIQRFRMRLLRFDFTIEHVSGKEFNIADALSRSPVDILSESNEFETETKAYVDSIVNNFPASDMRLQNIRDECVKDEICKTLMLYCKEGWPEKSTGRVHYRWKYVIKSR
ncbi:unnamed protein product [Mytilus coruscus]|uniref:Reverse transcriptase domain-containing protein n=1 Tax=Mytilus coruscus TaxID=42192 RepID=A0A6J8EH82_MYTCO|nr:unnamed protein product [Mytilus coruscus]